MIKSVADIDAASDAVLRAYLKAERVKFSESALRPELIAEARGHFTKKNAVPPPVPPVPAAAKQPVVEEPKVLPETMTVQDALVELHNRGFKDREEIIAFLNAQDREKIDVKNQRNALQATIDDIALRELHFAEREKSIVAKADEVRIDLAKNEILYDKLDKLKRSFPAGADLNV